MNRVAVWCVVLLIFGVVPAAAQDYDALVDDLRSRGYVVEDGAGVADVVEEAVANARRRGVRFYAVLLVGEPESGSAFAADELLRRLGDGTVLVVSPTDLGWSSTEFTEAELRQADAAAVPAFARSDAEGVAAFAEALPSEPTGDVGGDADAPATPRRNGPGIGTWLVLGLLVVGGIALFSGSRRNARLAERRREEAKAEVQRQIDTIADRILQLTDKVSLGSSEAQSTFAEATASFSATSDEFAGATSQAQLARLNDTLDRVRWQLDTVAALLDGKPPPPPLEHTEACFFDPDHGAGVEQEEIRMAAGSRTVGVCRDCAARLEAGEQPEVRHVTVDGHPVPVPQAPRPYGGRGWIDLDDFEVFTGGGRTVPYGWGRPSYRRRGWGGGFGGGGFGGGGFGGGFGGFGGGSDGRAGGGRSRSTPRVSGGRMRSGGRAGGGRRR